MSMDEQRKEIKNLIESLGDESLKRSHTSVLISFTQMLDYIQDIIDPVKQKDIRDLLQIYKDMSIKYYDQFELSLLQEIQAHRKTKRQSELAMRLIDGEGLTEEHEQDALKTAKNLLVTASKAANTEDQMLTENFPALLQDALNKLRDEWQRLGTIAVASQALARDKKLIESLETVVEVAAYSIGIEAQRIVIVPGKEFALFFFSYVEDFIVFTVPIYSVQAPWEWSIFWHELAGYQVRWLEKGLITVDNTPMPTIDKIRENLQDFHGRYKAITNEYERERLLRFVMRDNEFGYEHLKKLFSAERLNLIDLGNFDHQFEQMMSRLPKGERFKTYERMKNEGWCVDWFKELFEDAWSVLTIRHKFLSFLEDILRRHASVDARHPLLRIRLGVANELLKLSQRAGESTLGEDVLTFKPELSKYEKTVIKIAAEQLLTFLSLIVSASYKFDESVNAGNYDSVRQDNKIFEDLQTNEIQEVFECVRSTIQDSISDWSTKFRNVEDPASEAQKRATEIIDFFSEAKYIKLRQEKKSSKNLEPSYDKLLKRNGDTDKNYKELLELSFYESDFGVSNVANVYYFIHKKFETARLHGVPSEVISGAVRYESSGTTKYTSIESWNTAAVVGFQIT